MIPSLPPSTNLYLAGLNQLQSHINQATARLSSGYRLNQPSDAPDQISPLLQLQANLDHNQVVQANLTTVQAGVTSADQAVSTAIQLLDQARSIGSQGADGNTTAATRGNLAQQVESILEQMAGISNTTVAGRYIFSGDQDNTTSYALDSNPPVRIGVGGAAKVIPDQAMVEFTIQTTAGPSPPIDITGQANDSLSGQIQELNAGLQAAGLNITASLDGSGNLQFQSPDAFSVQVTGDASLLGGGPVPAAVNNTGLNHYEYTPQPPSPAGGDGAGNDDVKITIGGVSAIVTVPMAPQPADIVAINAALQAQNITNVSAVLDETNGNASISFQSSALFSVSDDHQQRNAYVMAGNSIATTGVNRLITPTATRQIELSDRSFTTAGQTAQELFDHRNADDSPAPDNVFFALNSMQLALADNSNPNQSSEILAAQAMLESASSYLNAKETFYGNTQNRITAAVNQINTENANLQQQISNIRDTDVVQTALDLTSAETEEQAALAAQGKVPHTSLFDFLG